MKFAVSNLAVLAAASLLLSSAGFAQVLSPSLSISPTVPNQSDVITVTLFKPAGSCVATPSTYSSTRIGSNIIVSHTYPYASTFEPGTCGEAFVLGVLPGGSYHLEWNEGIVGQETAVA